jgi:SAM-dependent methyltransferase
LIYNCTMAEDFARRAWPAIERLLLRELPSGSRVLDLCCGAGQIARRLTQRGFRVTGVDTSASMLRLACRNAPEAHFFVADARCFSLSIPQQAVLSTFNSFAHFHTPEELRAVSANVRAVLNSSGTFLFDLTMEEGYLRHWHGSFCLAGEEHACTVHPGYDRVTRMARNDVILEEHPPGGTKSEPHTSFTILQKCHTQREIVSALRDTGFSNIHWFDAERDFALAGDFGRRFFLAT